ncbi:hypothetical protein RFEPED_0073 [Rickettsia felis str. Pedreira]|uniref:Uncharacterized protein n=1 Tax=Rickettsia felis str. Pedreira TaxID=1359196 RepID=A0A0F3MQJ9_RICFI|nr:hypothetical protein RFEPED_0073 [Rickettsia felis str. Pedreira]
MDRFMSFLRKQESAQIKLFEALFEKNYLIKKSLKLKIF